MAKKMIIKGVGSFMAKRPDSTEVVTLGNLQDLKIDLNVDIEDIFGGDSVWAIDTLVKSKAIDITATDAKFDLASIQLMMGSSINENTGGDVWVLNERLILDNSGKGTLGYGSQLSATPEVAAREYDRNTLITPSSTAGGVLDFGASYAGKDIIVNYKRTVGTPVSKTESVKVVEGTNGAADVGVIKLSAGDSLVSVTSVGTLTETPFEVNTAPSETQYMVDVNTKQIYVNELSVDATVSVTYKYNTGDFIDVVDLLADEVPFPVHVVHHGSFMQKDGTYQGIETELFSCRANGTFSIDAQRVNAVAGSVSLKVLNPERADGRIGRIKRYSASARI